jgi:hypothetical protein
MPPSAILHEVQQLHDVSDRLDLLAGQHPLVSETLISIAGSVRNTATLLEILVAMKIPCESAGAEGSGASASVTVEKSQFHQQYCFWARVGEIACGC